MPGGPWTHAARYNLVRTYQASGRRPEAIKGYRADNTSPSRYGNLLRCPLAGGAEVREGEKVGR